DDRPHDQQQPHYENRRQQQGCNDDVDGVQARRIAPVVRPPAQAGERPQHGAQGLEKIELVPGRRLRIRCHAPSPGDGAAAARAPTSKNVYDKVMVCTSLGSLGSTTNTTGNWRVSRAFRSCCEKQKHSSFLKYWPATSGA